ncbi:thioesterase [Streptomyces sp. TRM S81-3]|uniref:Thioesterase n=1 Tax=Streptomyces griseicoloratus TaxID=2752516 RepID=A0A926QT92_9ACTN|nr:thioesterase domain-containing protein [Streptomyces griseicoloratus]MBD0422635.1 thioesterase [Streptomyces griseicoloratus]
MTLHDGTKAAAAPSPWTAGAVRRPGAEVRLYCLPFLGGPADFFLPLVRELPDWVEPCPVELPGYGRRLRESAVRDVPELARLLAEAVRRDTEGRPFAFFGHCAGGLLAFEAARELRRRSCPQPALLAVSATHPPHQWHLMTAELRARPLHRLAPVLRELAAQRGLHLASANAVVKREVSVYLRYRHQDEAPLDCPISVFGGREDAVVLEGALGAWADLSNGRVRNRVYPGRHFYVDDRWPDIARSLARDLRDALGPARGR